MNFIEYELTREIASADLPTPPKAGRVSRQLKHFPIAPEVNITPDDKGNLLLAIIAGDRPGLLARIAHVLARHGIAIRSARINTLGARAEDTFHIAGTALAQQGTIGVLREELQRHLA